MVHSVFQQNCITTTCKCVKTLHKGKNIKEQGLLRTEEPFGLRRLPGHNYLVFLGVQKGKV
jgi:hypothetical protein